LVYTAADQFADGDPLRKDFERELAQRATAGRLVANGQGCRHGSPPVYRKSSHYCSTTESNTLTFFQFSLFSSMNCLCIGASWYLSCEACESKTMCNPTSKSRSFTSRLKSSAKTPAAKKTVPGCFERYFLHASTSFFLAAGELSLRAKY